MSTKLSAKGQKVYDFFLANPNASAAKVAAKFKMSVSNVYKMRARAVDSHASAPPNFLPPPVLPVPEVRSSWKKIVQEVEATGDTDVDKTLDTRAQSYGKFKDGAALMQAIKRELAAHAAKHGKTFADDQWEALEMIVHKVGRIVNGDPDVVDHWVDIAGYATLVADRLNGRVR
jgi:hypothetical protein